MVVIQANKLSFPPSSSSSSPNITSLLFEPHSQSLALTHSDSSFSLYPSLSPLSPSPFPPRQTHIPSPVSSSSFLLLHSAHNPNSPTVLFIVSGPHKGGASVLLRFYVFQRSAQVFIKARVICSQKDLNFDHKLGGVILGATHGVSVKLSGSINVFAMHSVSSSKIWVFAVRIEDDAVKLMKCSVIECSVPVWSIKVSFGHLLLGEENGVRMFALRPLVKGLEKKDRQDSGKVKSRRPNEKSIGKAVNLPNGLIGKETSIQVRHTVGAKGGGTSGSAVHSSSGDQSRKKIDARCGLADSVSRDAAKLKSTKLRQESAACFVTFDSPKTDGLISSLLMSAKAISIHALSPTKFIILDSLGNLHLLCPSNVGVGSKLSFHAKQLCHVMNVQKLAVFADISTEAQTVWLSDGKYSLHSLTMSELNSPAAAAKKDEFNSEEKIILPVDKVIFTSEKIQDIVPLSTNAVSVLGQGNIFAYAFS